MRTVRAFFPKSEYFFSIFKKRQGRLLLPPHLLARLFTIKLKEKGKKNARENTCLRNWNSPCNVQGKAFWKIKLVLNFSTFHFCSTLHKWNPPHLSRILTRYTAGTFTEQLFSGTAILTENFRWPLLEL